MHVYLVGGLVNWEVWSLTILEALPRDVVVGAHLLPEVVVAARRSQRT
jgi:hypothetical protein